MATGVVIRLKNLPLSAGTIDIRHFFRGLRIPDGGVHIIGGDDGTAFILFATDEDARQAMLQDSQSLCEATIRLMLSSHTEMKTVIERSQRICEELRGLRPPEPPITNLSSHSNVSTFSQAQRHQTKPPSPEITPNMLDANDVHVEIKGMPYSVSQADIVYFFTPLSVSAIRFMLDEKGRKNGSGFVKFGSPMEKLEGLKRDRKYIGSRFVKLTSATERQWLLASSQNCETVRLTSDSISRKRQQSVTSPEVEAAKRSKNFSPIRVDNCVEVRGLPSTTTFKHVGDFFTGLNFADGGLYVEMEGSICKGIAYVEFKSYNDYKEALKKDGDMLNGKQVRVVNLSKQTMVEQIRRLKRYAKAKREELEKEKRMKEKKLKEEIILKRKDYQQRKQKEMDEWLRRQHAKEENERKKGTVEKTSSSYNIHSQNKLDQVMAENKDSELMKMKEELRSNEELRRQVVQEETKKIIKETLKRDEPVLGAGEMDIDEDNNDGAPQDLTSVVAMQPIASSSPATLGFSSILGTSGSMLASALPVNFNTAMPVINPSFAVPPLPPLQSNLVGTIASFSTPGLALPKPSFIDTLPSGNLNAPPLPPTMLPPPTPPVALTASVPTVPSGTAEPMASQQNYEPASSSVSVAETEFVRVANSPFNVSEEGVRAFFQGLSIPEHGIQFINKSNNRRSGHIFIKFSSKLDAAKAALKDDQILLGRSVLVKPATLKAFSQIYEKLTYGQPYKPTFDGPKTQSVVTTNSDNFFTKIILDDKMTCVCIGNVPPTTVLSDIESILGNIKYLKNKIIIMRDAEGKCKGDVYVELLSPEECVKAANLHGSAKIQGEIVRVLPLASETMAKDVNFVQPRQNTVNQRSSEDISGRHHSLLPKTNGSTNVQRSKDYSRSTDSTNLHRREHYPRPPTLPFGHADGFPPFNPRIPPPSMSHSDFYPLMASPPTHPPPPLVSADLLLPPLPPPPDDLALAQLAGRSLIDPPFGLLPGPPPPLGSRFPLSRSPYSAAAAGYIQTVRMSNLSYQITQEDILEFFTGFDPLSDSVRLMYNKGGKPTGDGVVSFSSYDAARAAVDRLNARPLLSRNIRLSLQ